MPFQSNNGWVQYPGDPNTMSDADRFRGTQYSHENAQTAFDNVMRDRGYNPYAANPFMQNLRQQARPLAQAWLMDTALAGRPGSNYGSNYQDWSENPYSFAGWLNQGMQGYDSGGGRIGGGIYSRMRQARNQFPQVLDAIRQNSATQSGDITQVNPSLNLLAQQFGADGGQGSVGAYQLLTSPFLAGQAMRQAYGQALDQRYANAARQQAFQPDPLQGDIWQYLFGR